MLSALVSLIVVGIVGLVVLTVLLAVFTAIFGLAVGVISLTVMLAMKILPVVLVGWLVVKLIQRAGRPSAPRSRLSHHDRRWLDS
jgi:membrane protein implicated in regulation of membrane protease activity